MGRFIKHFVYTQHSCDLLQIKTLLKQITLSYRVLHGRCTPLGQRLYSVTSHMIVVPSCKIALFLFMHLHATKVYASFSDAWHFVLTYDGYKSLAPNL